MMAAVLAAGRRRTWTPVSLPSLVAWFDAADAASITASGGAVSQWADKSGNNYHIAQSTGGAKPTTGATTQNGRNVLDFDGGDSLSRQTTPTTSQPGTVLCVARHTGAAGTNATVFDGYVHPTRWSVYQKQSTAAIAMYSGSVELSGSSSWASAWHCVCAIFNDSSSTLHVDGAADELIGVTPGTSALAGFGVGALVGNNGNFWTGSIAEVIVYASALSTDDRNLAEAYLKAKWGTP